MVFRVVHQGLLGHTFPAFPRKAWKYSLYFPFPLLLNFWLSAAFENCPLLGPVFPPPSNISSSQQDAFSNLTQALGQAITSGNSFHGLVNNQTFYSGQFFFGEREKATLRILLHYPSFYGVQKVDGDTVYRIASISKLLTV